MFTGEPVIVDDKLVYIPQFVVSYPPVTGINSFFNIKENTHIFQLDLDNRSELFDSNLYRIFYFVSNICEGLTLSVSTEHGHHIINFTPQPWCKIKQLWFDLLHHYGDEIIDTGFIFASIRRKHSTLRISNKNGKSIEYDRYQLKYGSRDPVISYNHFRAYADFIPEPLKCDFRYFKSMDIESLKELVVIY